MTDFFGRLVKEKPLSIIAGVIILLLILVAIFADVLAPFPHDEVNIVDRMQAPSHRYLLGTDQLGRDLLSRLLFGARISLTVGLAATTINVVVAVLIGGISGFFGGRLDLAMQRFVDAWMAFPGLLLLLTIMSLVGRGLPQIIVVLGVTGGIGGSRVVRGAVVGVKENVYFQAAEAIGSTWWRTLIRHVLPNIAAPVIIIFTINVGGVIISEAALSFLGFGLPISVPSWGGMLSREGREFMEVAPRLALWPGLCLTVVVYCLNCFGDAVRDLLDPRLRAAAGVSVPRSQGRFDRARRDALVARSPELGKGICLIRAAKRRRQHTNEPLPRVSLRLLTHRRSYADRRWATCTTSTISAVCCTSYTTRYCPTRRRRRPRRSPFRAPPSQWVLPQAVDRMNDSQALRLRHTAQLSGSLCLNPNRVAHV